MAKPTLHPVVIRRGVLRCPACGHDKLHQRAVEVFQRADEDSEAGGAWAHVRPGFDLIIPMDRNPSERRDGLRIRFECEECNLDRPGVTRALVIYQHKGETLMEWETT